MTDLVRARPATLAWLAALLVAAVAPLFASERQVFVLMGVLTLMVFSTSFNILLGYTGMVSFAHAAFYGVGAYTVALLALHVGTPPLLGFVLAPVVAGAVAYVTGLVALRATRLYFALLTLALGQLLFVIVFQWRGFTRGDDGIHGIVLPPALGPTVNRYYAILGLTVVAMVVMGVMMRSPFGATLQAIRENRERTGFLGLKVKRYELAAFTLGGAFAGYAGGMYALWDRGAFPLLLHWTTSAQPIFVALIGGLSSFAGPAVGAVVYGLTRDYIIRNVVYWQAVLGIVLLLIILFLPGGLVEGFRRLIGWIRRHAGARQRADAEPAASDEPADSPATTGGDRP